MDVTRERISRILEPTEILLSFQTGFNLFNAAVEEDCTSGLVVQVFDNWDKVGAYGCPQSCTSNPFQGLVEVYEDMVEVLLVLEIFLTEES